MEYPERPKSVTLQTHVVVVISYTHISMNAVLKQQKKTNNLSIEEKATLHEHPHPHPQSNRKEDISQWNEPCMHEEEKAVFSYEDQTIRKQGESRIVKGRNCVE